MTVAGLIAAVVVLLVAVIAARQRRPRRPVANSERRLLVPFTGGSLDPTVLSAAIRIARAEGATLVPAYLLVVPRSIAEDAPATREVALAMPVLEAVELEALRAGVPVDARIEKRQTPSMHSPAVGRRAVRPGRCAGADRAGDRLHAEGPSPGS